MNEITGVEDIVQNIAQPLTFQSAFDNYSYAINPVISTGLSTNGST